MQSSVTIHMAASPEQVWSLVSDVTNIGRFSPETFEAEWSDGDNAPAVGVRFRGHVRRNGKAWLVYWTKCRITACDPERDFAFDVIGPRGKTSVNWSYHFLPVGGGTDVTESFTLGTSLALRVYSAIAGRSRTRTNIRNMRATLERVKDVAESPEATT
jgi:Polyketide cyclase / dehydrase and lipid transport